MKNEDKKTNVYRRGIVGLLCSGVLALSLVGCGQTPSPETSQPNENAQASNSENTSTTSDFVFGKVKSITGNEISLDLAKAPQGGVGQSDSEQDSLEGGTGGDVVVMPFEGGSDDDTEGGADGGGEPHGATGLTSPDGSVDLLGSGDSAKLELEYTGETKEFTIPSGLKIYNAAHKEVTIKDIKEGSVLLINYDKAGNIELISIME